MSYALWYLWSAVLFIWTIVLTDPYSLRGTHPFRLVAAMCLWPAALLYATWTHARQEFRR